MTLPQWFSIGTLAGMMALFLWGRFRYDITAVIALLAALALGIVAPADAFSGFSDDIVIIVGSALVLSAAVQRSGVVESTLAVLSQRITRIRSQLLLLTASVGVASALIKNVGALAMLMPAALQMARKGGTSPSVFLMPMSFASLLGGLMTLVGTSPNIIVSRVREDLTGQPFGMFDYFPTGFGLFDCIAAGRVIDAQWACSPLNRVEVLAMRGGARASMLMRVAAVNRVLDGLRSRFAVTIIDAGVLGRTLESA